MKIMGILNVTPDSFYDGGRYIDVDSALKRVGVMLEEGAEIIDVGGESTRPGFTPVSIEEEISRVCSVIEAIKKEYPEAIVSLDTYKPDVAREGLKSGADMINDIWGLKWDPRMAGIIKEYDASCILMHNRKEAVYDDLIEDMLLDLKESVEIAKKAGITDDKIILDPGIGFAKDTKQNLQVMKNLRRFNELGYPMLLAASNKSFIGNTLGLEKDKRVIGTCTTSVLAYLSGYEYVRVHNIAENAQAMNLVAAIMEN
ncbi:MAG: dihydropteroate synthase [Lachnospiraceae bacterium]|nr:dihydropteroate synthase [Lachnospiraceae bacterium]